MVRGGRIQSRKGCDLSVVVGSRLAKTGLVLVARIVGFGKGLLGLVRVWSDVLELLPKRVGAGQSVQMWSVSV